MIMFYLIGDKKKNYSNFMFLQFMYRFFKNIFKIKFFLNMFLNNKKIIKKFDKKFILHNLEKKLLFR